ncbi:hypothetical protein RJG79_08550 [Mycoplasmatota bacterium WC44]
MWYKMNSYKLVGNTSLADRTNYKSNINKIDITRDELKKDKGKKKPKTIIYDLDDDIVSDIAEIIIRITNNKDMKLKYFFTDNPSVMYRIKSKQNKQEYIKPSVALSLCI